MTSNDPISRETHIEHPSSVCTCLQCNKKFCFFCTTTIVIRFWKVYNFLYPLQIGFNFELYGFLIWRDEKKKKKCFFAAGNIKMFNSCCTAFRPPSSFVASRILFETLCFYSSSFASIFLNLHPPTPFSCCLGCRHVSFILSVVFSFQRLLAETFIYDVQKLFKYCTKKKKQKNKKTC